MRLEKLEIPDPLPPTKPSPKMSFGEALIQMQQDEWDDAEELVDAIRSGLRGWGGYKYTNASLAAGLAAASEHYGHKNMDLHGAIIRIGADICRGGNLEDAVARWGDRL